MKSDKPWNDDLRAIGSQIKAGYSEDLTGDAGQAMKAFSPKDSAIYQKGQELVDDAADTAKENASDYEGRGAIAKPLLHTARFLSGVTAPLIATAPLMVSPFTQAAVLGLLGGGASGQKTYEKFRDSGATSGRAVTEGVAAALVGGAGSALMTPAYAVKSPLLTAALPAAILGTRSATYSAGRAAERGFARLVNESGLATRKYDKFAANVAGITDKLKTVSTQGVPALPKPDV